MGNNFNDGLATGFFVFLGLIVLATYSIIGINDGMWERSAIKAEVGRYNDKTAVFEWIIKPELEEKKNGN